MKGEGYTMAQVSSQFVKPAVGKNKKARQRKKSARDKLSDKFKMAFRKRQSTYAAAARKAAEEPGAEEPSAEEANARAQEEARLEKKRVQLQLEEAHDHSDRNGHNDHNEHNAPNEHMSILIIMAILIIMNKTPYERL